MDYKKERLYSTYKIQYALFCGHDESALLQAQSLLSYPGHSEIPHKLARYISDLESRLSLNCEKDLGDTVNKWISSIPKTSAAIRLFTISNEAIPLLKSIFGRIYHVHSKSESGSSVTMKMFDLDSKGIPLNVIDLVRAGWGKIASEHYRRLEIAVPEVIPEFKSTPARRIQEIPEDIPTVRETFLEETKRRKPTPKPELKPPQVESLRKEVLRKIEVLKNKRTGKLLTPEIRDVFRDIYEVGNVNIESFNTLTEELWAVLKSDFDASPQDLEQLKKNLELMASASNSITSFSDVYGSKMMVAIDYLTMAARSSNEIIHRIVEKYISNVIPEPDNVKVDVFTSSPIVARALFDGLNTKRDAIREETEDILERAFAEKRMTTEMFETAHELFEPLVDRMNSILEYMSIRLIATRQMTIDEKEWIMSMFSEFVDMLRKSDDFKSVMRPETSLKISNAFSGLFSSTRGVFTLIFTLFYGFVMLWAIFTQVNIGEKPKSLNSTTTLDGMVKTARDIKDDMSRVDKKTGDVIARDGSISLENYKKELEREIRESNMQLDQLGRENNFDELRQLLQVQKLSRAETPISEMEKIVVNSRDQSNSETRAFNTILEEDPALRVEELKQQQKDILDRIGLLSTFETQISESFNAIVSGHFEDETALQNYESLWKSELRQLTTNEGKDRIEDIGAHVKELLTGKLGISWSDLSSDSNANTMRGFVDELSETIRQLNLDISRWEHDRSMTTDLVNLYHSTAYLRERNFDSSIKESSAHLSLAEQQLKNANNSIASFENEAKNEARNKFTRDVLFKRILDANTWGKNAAGTVLESLFPAALKLTQEYDCANILKESAVRDNGALTFKWIRRSFMQPFESLGKMGHFLPIFGGLVGFTGSILGNTIFNSLGFSSLEHIYSISSGIVQTFMETFVDETQLNIPGAFSELMGSLVLSYAVYILLRHSSFLASTAVTVMRGASIGIRRMVSQSSRVANVQRKRGNSMDPNQVEDNIKGYNRILERGGAISGGLRALAWVLDKTGSFYENVAVPLTNLPFKSIPIGGLNLPGLATLLPVALVGMKIVKLTGAIYADYEPWISLLAGFGAREWLSAASNIVWDISRTTFIVVVSRVGITRQRTVREELLSGTRALNPEGRSTFINLINALDTYVCCGPYLKVHAMFGGTIAEIRRREKDKDYTLGFVMREMAATGANMAWMLLLTRQVLPLVIKTTFVQFGDKLIDLNPKQLNSIDYDSITKSERISAFTELRASFSSQIEDNCVTIIDEFKEPDVTRIPGDIYDDTAHANQVFIDLNNRLERIKDYVASIPKQKQAEQIELLLNSLPKNIFDFTTEDLRTIFELPSPLPELTPPQ